MTRRGWALFGAMVVIWALPYLCIRVAVREIDPGCLVLARTLPAACVLLPPAYHQKVLGSLRGKWGWLVAYSFIEFGIPWLVMSDAERHISSSLTGLIVCTVPLISIVLAKLAHPHRAIGKARLSGLVLGATGVTVLVGLDTHGSNWFWVGTMVVVTVGYSIGPIILDRKMADASGLAVVATSVAVVATAYLPWGIGHWPHHLRSETWLSIAILTTICTAAAFLVFFALIQEVGAARSVVVTFANTAFAVILGVWLLHENFTVGMALGFPLIVAGSYYATRKSPHEHELAAPADLRPSA